MDVKGITEHDRKYSWNLNNVNFVCYPHGQVYFQNRFHDEII